MEYTVINEPETIRKSLLLFSKSMISALMHYEKLKVIRNEKMSLIKEYNETIDQIVTILNQIQKLLPEVKDETQNVKKTQKKSKTVTQNKPKPNRMQKLYSQLEEINKKLGSLQ